MFRYIRVRSLESSARRGYNTVAAPGSTQVKRHTLSKKFVYPFTFEEASHSTQYRFVKPLDSRLGKQASDTHRSLDNKVSALGAEALAKGHPWRAPVTVRSRLSPKFRMPSFDE